MMKILWMTMYSYVSEQCQLTKRWTVVSVTEISDEKACQIIDDK